MPALRRSWRATSPVRPASQTGGSLNKRDAEDAEPRLTPRPRRTRYDRTIRCAPSGRRAGRRISCDGNGPREVTFHESRSPQHRNLRPAGSRPRRARPSGWAACRSRVAPPGAAAYSASRSFSAPPAWDRQIGRHTASMESPARATGYSTSRTSRERRRARTGRSGPSDGRGRGHQPTTGTVSRPARPTAESAACRSGRACRRD